MDIIVGTRLSKQLHPTVTQPNAVADPIHGPCLQNYSSEISKKFKDLTTAFAGCKPCATHSSISADRSHSTAALTVTRCNIDFVARNTWSTDISSWNRRPLRTLETISSRIKCESVPPLLQE